ncbi:MAG: hypothetical protein CL569_16175 [Alphaproteobacteria bacterium]|nr:hypothetical protein [Alphaproteobacteria bacterium]
MTKIAILGASGFVGRSLAAAFAATTRHRLLLFSREPERQQSMRWHNGGNPRVRNVGLDEFPDSRCDIIINAIGVGDPAQVELLGSEIMRLSQDVDELVLDNLSNNQGALCIALSSGAVYGELGAEAVTSHSSATYPVNSLGVAHCYAVSKLNSETMHRANSGLNIVDLRLFGFVSRYVDSQGGFLLAQALAAIQNGTVLRTLPQDVMRDYVHPEDLCQLVERCAAARPINTAFDVFTRAPTSKFDLLQRLSDWFGLQWRIDDDPTLASGAIEKINYYSLNRAAEAYGYYPTWSAMDAVTEEFGHILRQTMSASEPS